MLDKTKKKTGAESVLWNLEGLYQSPDDPRLVTDLAEYQRKARAFEDDYKGKLHQKLGPALSDYQLLTRYEYSLYRYPSLMQACDQTNEDLRQLMSRISETMSRASSQHLTFFSLEVGKLDEADYQRQLEADEQVAHHRPMLDHIRKLARYQLSEDAERIESLLSPYGPSEWDDFVDEMEADLRITLDDESLTLQQALNIINTSKDAELRERALKEINQGLKRALNGRYRARALNAVIGQKQAMDDLRGYESDMSSRNLGNQVDDETVKALHDAVRSRGVEACKRFYRLLSTHLNDGEFKMLKWSDRNAPLPFSDSSVIEWNDAVELVKQAYQSFSPTLSSLVEKIIDNQWVDAPTYEGKSSGAFNASGPYLNGDFSYNLLNFQGANHDVSTLAHELGHGVHGLLALKKQGPLMWHAPMAYAETASIFGEMITFNFQLQRCESDEQKLALLMVKINDFLNTVVRQISFSEFEQRIHAERRKGKLKVEDFNRHWMEVCVEFYGEDGEVFSYDPEMMDSLWCYVGHFMHPFYVYAYAFGELFTQSLYALKDSMDGDQFEQKYLDLLRAGGTRNAVQLMKPFGLDPNDPQFWLQGMQASVFNWLDEAEKISARLKI